MGTQNNAQRYSASNNFDDSIEQVDRQNSGNSHSRPQLQRKAFDAGLQRLLAHLGALFGNDCHGGPTDVAGSHTENLEVPLAHKDT